MKTIEGDPDGWYCYTAIHSYKRHVLLAYCAGSLAKKTYLAVTCIRRSNLPTLYSDHRNSVDPRNHQGQFIV